MKNKPRTLVILTPGFPADEQDTTCLPAQQAFVRSLNRNYPGLKVILLSFEYPHRRDNYSWFGNTVISFNGWKDGWNNKLRTCMAVWKMLNRLRREYEIVGLLSFWVGGCALVGKYYGRGYRLPHFTWILGQDARKGNKFIPLIRPAAGELVAMSDFLAKEFHRNYKITPEHVIPNGVDPSLYPVETPDRGIDLLGVGSLIPLKQYDLFVSVTKELSRRLPDIRAVICGKGPELKNLQEMIRRQELQERLTLVGEQAHQATLGFMQRAKVFLHTSSYEGFSTVCLEALYAGAHVISFTDPVGTPVKNWHVVTSREEMVSKALAILQDPHTDYSRVKLHTMDDSARDMMRLYDYRDAAIF